MKKLLSTFGLCLLATATWAQGGIRFEGGTYEQALQKAKNEGKGVFVFLTNLWYPLVHDIEYNVLASDSVGAYMNPKYVSVKVDIDRGDGLRIKEMLGEKYAPQYIFFNPDGTERGRFGEKVDLAHITKYASEFIRYVGLMERGDSVDKVREREIREEHRNQGRLMQSVATMWGPDTIYHEGKGIQFLDITFNEALQRAKAENKRIFMDCYTSWCGPCKEMMRTVFQDTRIGNLMNQQFICIKQDMEKGEGVELQKRYKCQAYPTFLIINQDGTEYNRFVGSGPHVSTFTTDLAKCMVGIEDEYSQRKRLADEEIAATRGVRKANLHKTPRKFPATPLNVVSGYNVSEALAKAKKQGKDLALVFMKDDWKTDYVLKYGLQDKQGAQQVNKHTLFMLVDAESTAGDQLMEQYGLPDKFLSMVLLSPDGEVIGQHAGFVFKDYESVANVINYIKNPPRRH